MALARKNSWVNLDKYLPAFKKMGFEAMLADLESKLADLEGGILPSGSVSLAELEAAVQASLAKADSAVQPGVANDIADLSAASAAGTDAALIDAANAKIDAILAEMRNLGLLNV